SLLYGLDAHCRDDLVKIWMHSQPACLPRVSASPTSPAIDMCAPRIGRLGLPVFAIVTCRLYAPGFAGAGASRFYTNERPKRAALNRATALARDAHRWILHYSCELRSSWD